MSDDEENSSSEPAQTSSEPRACEDENGPQSGSNDGPGDGPDSEYERIWNDLTRKQKEVVLELPFASTIGEAAESVGRSPSTVYSWNTELEKKWGHKLQDIAEMMADEREKGLREGIAALSGAAVRTLRQALDPDTPTSRVDAETAQYVIDRLRGRPTRKQEIEHSGGIDLDEGDEDALDSLVDNLNAEEDKGEE